MVNGTRIDQSTLNNASTAISKNTESLISEIDSMLSQLKQSREAYQTTSSVTAQMDSVIAELESVKNGYLGHSQDFATVLSNTLKEYLSADANIQARAGGLDGNASGQAAGSGNGVERPSYVPENATQTADGRWAVLDENGKGTIYNNKGIGGTPFETDDVRLKALASGMDGGQVVKLDDGRVAVKDKYGGGVIFNEDGSTQDVSGRTVVAGKVETIQASTDGADPYTQDLASEIINADLDNRKTNRLIKGYESQQEAEGTDSVLSVDTDALRDQLEFQKENGAEGIANYGPGYSPEQNAQALIKNASDAISDKLPDVNNIGNQMLQKNPSSDSSTLVSGGVDNTLGTQVSDTATTGQPLNLNDYGPCFSKEHNDAVLAARTEQQVGVGVDTSTAGTTVSNIPEPSQPIGFDPPMTEVATTDPVQPMVYTEDNPIPDYADYLPF